MSKGEREREGEGERVRVIGKGDWKSQKIEQEERAQNKKERESE